MAVSRDKDIDVEDVLQVLNDASKHYALGTRESNAFETAAFCLLYVRHIDKLKDFAAYYRERLDPNFRSRSSGTSRREPRPMPGFRVARPSTACTSGSTARASWSCSCQDGSPSWLPH